MNRLIYHLLRGLTALVLISTAIGVHVTSHSPLQDIHPMPPHPMLAEKLEREGHPFPDLRAKLNQGIDQTRPDANPPSGNFNLLVVLVNFSDHPASVGPFFFDNLIFIRPGPGFGSVAQYYTQVSYGSFTLVTVNPPSSVGWVPAPRPHNGASGYVNADGIPGTSDDYGWGAYPNNLQGIVAEIIPTIDPLIDFSHYDNDNDGFVESIVFVHAGPGAEITGSPNDIWSSAWDLTAGNGPGPIQTQEGVWIDNFTFDPEFMFNPGDQTIGVYCHELGHTIFGLPDLYDYDLSSNGVGNWSLMGYGAWNGPAGWGDSPAWPDAWSRVIMGFDFALPMNGNISPWLFQPVEFSGPGIGIVKLDSPQLGAQEYFLVEYRDTAAGSFDAYLPGSGLLIWHVDEEKWNMWEMNTYECRQQPCCSGGCATWHPLVALVQADGLLNLEYAANYGDTGDPFPGSTNNMLFGYGTTPESGSYLANPCPSNSCIAVQITAAWPMLIQANLRVVCTVPGGCLNVSLDEPVGWGSPGSEVTYRASVQNCSNGTDLATLYAYSNWPATFYDLGSGQPIPPPPTGFIFPGGAWSVGISVTVPAGAQWSAADPLTITAESSYQGIFANASGVTRVPNCILVVDDDRSAPDVEPIYLAALANGGYQLDYWDAQQSGSPSLYTLAAHTGVVWFTGTPRFATLGPRDEMALSNYLSAGGNLFLSSQDYLYDVGRSAFNRIQLHISTFVNDTGTSIVTGVAGNPVGNGLGPYPFVVPASLSDQVLPISPAAGAFVDFMGLVNALSYDSGSWRTLFLAWPFENLQQPNADELMTAAVDWFDIPASPQVAFTVIPSPVCVGEVITFTNQSQNATAYLWNFGDGFTSTMTDTTHTYTAPITATVTLTGSNCCGAGVAQQSFPVYAQPIASFNASPTQVLIGVDVTFTNTSQAADTYLWEFGDGMTSTLTNPSHSYSSPGDAVVELTAFSQCGSTTVTQTISIYASVAAGFTPGTLQAKVGQPVQFTNTSQNADTYLWEFGDGIGTSTELHPTYAYSQTGWYTVTLTAANPVSMDTTTQSIRVSHFTYLPLAQQGASLKRLHGAEIAVPLVIALLFTGGSLHARRRINHPSH
jgi:M6 family metalloprotease-like protein